MICLWQFDAHQRAQLELWSHNIATTWGSKRDHKESTVQ